MNNFDAARKAMENMAHSAGSADKEMDVIKQSLEYKVNAFKETGTSIAQNLFKKEDMKSVVDFGTTVLEVIDKITGKLGLFGTVGAGAGIGVFIKEFGNLKNLFQEMGSMNLANSINSLKSLSSGVFDASSINQYVNALGGLSLRQAEVALSTTTLNDAQKLQILTSAGLVASEESISSALAMEAMTQAGVEQSTRALVAERAGLTTATSTCTQAQLMDALATQGIVGADAEAIVSAMGLTTANTAEAFSFEALATSIMTAAASLATFLLTNPVGWAIDAAAILVGVAVAYDKFGFSMDKAIGKASDARQSFETAKQEVSKIESEQSKLRNELAELAGKYSIEVTDDDTIGTLRQKIESIKSSLSDDDKRSFSSIESQNDLLYAQLKIKEKIRDSEQKTVAKTANDVLTKTGDGVWLDEFDKYGNQIYKRETLLQETTRKQGELNKLEKEELDLLKKQRDYDPDEKTLFGKNQWQKYQDQIDATRKKQNELTGEVNENLGVISENYAALFDESGNPLPGFEKTAESVKYFLENMMGVKDSTDEVKKSSEEMERSYTSLVDGVATKVGEFKTKLSEITDAVNAQTTGKTISLDDYSNLKEYSSALEYHNGVMQFNLDKVKEITKAKYEEEKANIANGKAMDQSKYLENARKIQELREKQNNVSGQERAYIQQQIDGLLQENSTLVEACRKWDILGASIDQANSRYQNWLNSQNAAQSGEMFDSSLSAFKKINDTLNKSDSDDFGRIGNADYKAAVEFIIPDKVSSQGEEAINSYMTNLKKYLTFDDNGEADGLNIQQFCQDALDRGLMQVSKDGKRYEIAGQQTMEEFANGMGLALPFVQAVFGEMEEFGAEFDWSDESVRTFGDLAMKANESAEALRKVDAFKNMNLVLDVSNFEDKTKAVNTLNEEIEQLTATRKTLSVDSSEYQQAGDVIQYLVAERQMLEQPAIMTVDTSQVTGKVGEAISLLQQYQQQKNEIEILQSVGADTSQAEAKLAELQGKIASSDAMATVGLKLDPNSDIGGQIDSAIAGLDQEKIIKFGVDTSAIDGYEAPDQTPTVKYETDTSEPDNYKAPDQNPTVTYGCEHSAVDTFLSTVKNLSKTITYTYVAANSPPKGAGVVNGTAHVSGTAYAGGNWGTAPGGETLVGELGRTLPMRIYIG